MIPFLSLTSGCHLLQMCLNLWKRSRMSPRRSKQTLSCPSTRLTPASFCAQPSWLWDCLAISCHHCHLDHRIMRSSTNLFLLNLSIADLFVLVTSTPTALVEIAIRRDDWILGKVMWLMQYSPVQFITYHGLTLKL